MRKVHILTVSTVFKLLADVVRFGRIFASLSTDCAPLRLAANLDSTEIVGIASCQSNCSFCALQNWCMEEWG